MLKEDDVSVSSMFTFNELCCESLSVSTMTSNQYPLSKVGVASPVLVLRSVFWCRVSYSGVAFRNLVSRLVLWRRVLFSGDASSVLVSRFVLWWTGVLLQCAVVVAWLARRLVRLGVP